MGHEFLARCHSTPKTIAELAVGETFIPFPQDGDDSGHGGFKGGAYLLVKIEPFHPGEMYHPDFRYTCHRHDDADEIFSLPLSYPVIPVGGVGMEGSDIRSARADHPRYFGLWTGSRWVYNGDGVPIAFPTPAPLFASGWCKVEQAQVAVIPPDGGAPTEFLERPASKGVGDGR